MSEPAERARRIVEVVPGVHRWWVSDDRIGGAQSDAYAIVAEGLVTLVDPLPIAPELLERLGEVEAIALTAANHQRSAWRFRRRFGAPVFAPEGVKVGLTPGDLEETPDIRFSGGDLLTCGLVAFHTPGPAEQMFTFWLERPRSVAFLSDLLTHSGHGTPRFVAAEYQTAPWRTRESVRWLRDHLPLEVLCFAHGPPIVQDGREALARALAHDDLGAPLHPQE